MALPLSLLASRTVSPLLTWGILGAAALFALAYNRAGDLGDISPAGIDDSVHQHTPLQVPTTMPPFNFTYEGTRYIVTPRAEYELRGLIVTHNNTTGIGDIYHDESSVDLKDICVIWGRNTSTGIYKDIMFWSDPWTCFIKPKSRGASEQFVPEELSNNHLLAGTTQVKEKIRSLRIGDQVALKGYLVDYAPSHAPSHIRTTSLTRHDTGDGACEVFFVTDTEILSRAPGPWYRLKSISGWAFMVLALVKIASTIVMSQKEYDDLKKAGEITWESIGKRSRKE